MADAYVDHSYSSGTLTGTLTFTNASATVTGSGTAFTTELANGNYVRVSDGLQWYKVTARASDTSMTISPAFQQTTVTDTANASKKNAGVGSLADAYAHLSQATTDSVRSPGDIIYMRANLTYTYKGVHVVFDEDGTISLPITLQGCSSTIDPWGDASDVVPIIDFGGTAVRLLIDGDDFWTRKNLDARNSIDVFGALGAINCQGTQIINCKTSGNTTGISCILSSAIAGRAEIDGATITGNTESGLYLTGVVEIKNTSIDNSAKGLYILTGIAEIENTSFGQTIANTIDIQCSSGIIRARRCIFNFEKVTCSFLGSAVYSEDHNQVVGDHKSKYYQGMVERETTEVRSGGADNSIKVTPNANNHTNFPWQIHEWSEEAVAASAQTRGVYIEVTGIDATYPTVAQLWFEAESFSAGSGTAKQINKSTAVLAANSTWTWFPVTFTPGQVGKVRYRVYLAMPTEGATQDVYYIDNQLRDGV